ncbi:hypothetical protein D3C73_902970 [compost metagenome]
MRVLASNPFTVGELLEIVSQVRTENTTFDGLTNGFDYNNPVIPASFVAVNTDDAKWNSPDIQWDNGLVIQDQSGNQFVWVPIDGTNVPYSKWTISGVIYSNSNLSDDTLPSGFNENAMINKYKGFYIARYEASFNYNEGNIRPRFKKSINKTTSNWSRTSSYDGYLWNYINYIDAKLYSENMASKYGYDESKVLTNLVTGTQWDTVMKWIKNSGKNVIDSRSWGNYDNSISPANVAGYSNLQISGYSNYWKAKNIYDLAGNTWEWTNEKYWSDFVFRGGYYDNDATSHPVSFRYSGSNTYGSPYLSFRSSLYIN